jgi:hypothetical protein
MVTGTIFIYPRTKSAAGFAGDLESSAIMVNGLLTQTLRFQIRRFFWAFVERSCSSGSKPVEQRDFLKFRSQSEDCNWPGAGFEPPGLYVWTE